MNKVTRTVSAREANQQFSQLLAAVERGEQVMITKHGKPVATMAPARETTPEDLQQREAALARIRSLIQAGFRHGGRRYSRDEMHQR
jgi:prevent-host-death family protein